MGSLEPITLILTREQAYVLRAILSSVGGDPDGPRGRADEVIYELDTQGITCDMRPVVALEAQMNPNHQDLYFGDFAS
jgi:hypothetical protein